MEIQVLLISSTAMSWVGGWLACWLAGWLAGWVAIIFA